MTVVKIDDKFAIVRMELSLSELPELLEYYNKKYPDGDTKKKKGENDS